MLVWTLHVCFTQARVFLILPAGGIGFFCGGCAGEEGCLCPKVRQLSWGRPRLRPGLTGSAPGGRAGVWMSGFFNQRSCSFSGSTWCSHFPVCMCVCLCVCACVWPDVLPLWSLGLRLQTHLIQLSSSTCWLRGLGLQSFAPLSEFHGSMFLCMCTQVCVRESVSNLVVCVCVQRSH